MSDSIKALPWQARQLVTLPSLYDHWANYSLICPFLHLQRSLSNSNQ
ncbi:MAG: hypothetical protein ACK47G_04885 [Pseudanabaena sp.]